MKYFFLFILLFNFPVQADQDLEQAQRDFEQKRWNQIQSLIQAEMQTINRSRKKTLKLKYRLFELKSELIKLYKEKENKEFMEKKAKWGKKVSRKKSFKKTLDLYHDAHRFGQSLLKRYPNSRYQAAIYYTLALNSRDFSYDKKQLTYLRKAIKYSSASSKVNYLARTSLAEYYYNNKQWKAAIYQYELVLKNQDDEWHTKNLLNYGWCQLKNHQFEKAIVSLEKSHQLSEDDYYVDVRDQVMSGLINFYVYGKQIDRGVEFINKNAVDKQASLLNLAQKASQKGYFPAAEKITLDLEDQINPQQRAELYADLRLFQFDLYKQFHKPNKLLAITKLFPATKFNDYQREDAVRKISDLVGAKQVILKKDFSKHEKVFNRSTLSEIIAYFDILAAINTQEVAQYEYFKAETYFSVQQFDSALTSYKKSIVDWEQTPSKEDLRKKNLDALFACIDNLKLSKQDQTRELEFAYNKYLSYWPKDKKAQEIYPRLYALYAQENDYPKMQTSLDRYISAFPGDRKKQQDLYRAQVDLLIQHQKTQLLSSKIKQMQQGYLKFSAGEIKKSEKILATILFKKFQQMNRSGEQNKALEGYKAVFFTEYYPDSIKAEAAFNMGMIFTDFSNNNEAIKWYQKSFDFFTPAEMNKKRLFLEKMALRTALLHDFVKAARLNTFLLKSFCDQKKKNLSIFTAAIRNDLANDYMTKVNNTINKYQQCVSVFPNSLKKEIMTHLFENNHQSEFMAFVEQYDLAKVYPEEVSFYYERLFWQYFEKNPGWVSKVSYQLKKVKEAKAKLLMSTLPLYQKLKKELRSYKRNRIAIQDSEDPNIFAQKLQKRLAKLQPLIKKADQIFSKGHGQISVLVYDRLTDLTQSLASEMLAYSLPIPDPEFQKQFKAQMGGLAQNFRVQKENFQVQAQSLVEKYELLVVRRDDSHSASEIMNISDIRPKASEMAITIGLGR